MGSEEGHDNVTKPDMIFDARLRCEAEEPQNRRYSCHWKEEKGQRNVSNKA